MQTEEAYSHFCKVCLKVKECYQFFSDAFELNVFQKFNQLPNNFLILQTSDMVECFKAEEITL